MVQEGSQIAHEGYAIGIAAKVSGLHPRTIERWAKAGLIVPSIAQTTGKGYWNLFSFSDLVALRAAARMRKHNVSLQALRRALAALKAIDASASLANTCLVSDGYDIYSRNGQQVRSLLKKPGQLAFTWVIDLKEVESEVRQMLRAA